MWGFLHKGTHTVSQTTTCQMNFYFSLTWASQEAQWHTGDPGSIPGLVKSPEVGNGNSNILAWKIPWTRRPWWATVHGVAKQSKITLHTHTHIYAQTINR